MHKAFKIVYTVLMVFSTMQLFAQVNSLNKIDENGHKQGYWQKANEEGMLLYEGHFIDDIPVDTFNYFYPDGIVKARSVFSENGEKSFVVTYHHSGNAMSRGYYLGKKKDSLWEYFNMDGILLKHEFYRNFKKQGIWKTFFDDGTVAEETSWDQDKQNGPWKQYFADGKIKASGQYSNDEKQGQFDFYYSSGRIKISGNYEASYRTGDWLYMDEKGNVTKIETYIKGKVVRTQDFKD